MPEERYLGHQSDWQDNNKRCPLYLEDLADEDEEWPEEGDQAVSLYHQEKTYFLLRKLLEKLDKEQLEKTLEQFPGLLNGFVLEDIYNFELRTVLIGRIE